MFRLLVIHSVYRRFYQLLGLKSGRQNQTNGLVQILSLVWGQQNFVNEYAFDLGYFICTSTAKRMALGTFRNRGFLGYEFFRFAKKFAA